MLIPITFGKSFCFDIVLTLPSNQFPLQRLIVHFLQTPGYIQQYTSKMQLACLTIYLLQTIWYT